MAESMRRSEKTEVIIPGSIKTAIPVLDEAQ